jgi:hypothetical protein
MDWLRKVKELFLRFLNEHPEFGEPTKHMRISTKSESVWELLVQEDNHDLIEKLHKVERKEKGYGTIVVPKDGFSKNGTTNQAVIDWLEEHDVNVLDPQKEISELKEALHGNRSSKEKYNAVT